MDAGVHAIVADGHLGQDGSIQNWPCQACGGHASDRFGAFLYRLKKPETVIAQTLTSVSQGQGIRATALSQGVNKDTVLAWWMRLGERAPVLWDEIAQGKVRVGAVQLDELHTLIKKRGNHLTELEGQVGGVGVQWVWTAMDPAHKLLLVAQVGPRTHDMTCLVMHALCQMLAPGCVPAFSSDGLMHYFTALTAHWGSWQVQAQGKRVWQVAANLWYAQVVKQYRRRKLTHVVRRLLLGTQAAWEAALQAAGMRISINTALVERLNLTLRQSLAALTRQTLCLAKTRRHL
jgi:IS1 family transposase